MTCDDRDNPIEVGVQNEFWTEIAKERSNFVLTCLFVNCTVFPSLL